MTKQWIKDSLEICEGINHYYNDEVNIFFANCNVDFPCDTHIHDDFELMTVKRQTLENVICDDKRLTIPLNKAIMFNPLQRHGLNVPTKVDQFICVAFSKEFGQRIAKECFDEEQLVFNNVPFVMSAYLNYLIGKLFDTQLYTEKVKNFIVSRLLDLIFVEIINDSENNLNQFSSGMRTQIYRAVEYLESHFCLPYDLNELAQVANMSVFHFLREFKKYTNVSPYDYFVNTKIKKEQSYLAETNKTNTTIAEELGFSTPSHFASVFKKIVGISPSEYKRTVIK